MVRLVGSNTPELTDFTQQNYAKVQQNMLQNFEGASQALAAQAEMHNADYQARLTEWQNKEKAKQIQAEGGGGGALSGIAEIGKQLVAGYVIIDELKNKKKLQQAELENAEFQKKRALEADKLEREKFEYSKAADTQDRADKVAAAEAKAQEETQESALDTALNMTMAEVENMKYKIGETVKRQGLAAGTAALEEQFKIIQESEWFNLLDDERKSQVILDINKWRAEYNLGKAENVYDNEQKLISSYFQTIHEQWLGTNAAKIQQINNGIGMLSPERVNELVEEMMLDWDSLMSKDEYKYLLANKQAALDARIKIMQTVGGAVNKYYGDVVEGDFAAARLVKATNEIALMEMQKAQGKMTDLEFYTKAEATLKRYGVGTSYDELPTSLPNRMAANNEQLEALEKQFKLQQRSATNARILGNQTPQGRDLQRYNIGQYIYNNLDNLDVAISELSSLDEDRAAAIDAPAIIELAKRLPGDKNEYMKIHQQILQKQEELQTLSYKPDRKEVIIQQGQPLGLSPDGTPLGLSGDMEAGTVPYREGDSPIPNASPERMQTIKEQIDLLKKQQMEIINRWLPYGINIADPKDPAHLNRLKERVQATQQMVNQKATEQGVTIGGGGISPQSTNTRVGQPAATATSQPKGTLQNVNNAVAYEFNAKDQRALMAGFYGGVSAMIPDPKAKESTRNNYQKFAQVVLSKTLGGASQEEILGIAKEARNTIGFSSTGKAGEMAEKALINLYRSIQNKQNYYKNYYGLQSRSNSPPSFPSGSQGQRQEVKGALATIDNEGEVAPAVHLKGNLAVHKDIGWTPFKGGTVTLTSDYRSKHRPRHNGIDIVSTDPRVATIQGGKVKWAGRWANYGNIVFVETRDGKLEVFAHLANVNVKKGQQLEPGEMVGKMGGTGNTDTQYAPHLHFEIWTNLNWNHPSEAGWERGNTSPLEYLGRFKGKVALPTGTGVRGSTPQSTNGSSDQPQWTYTEKTVAYHTGAIKLSNNLVYYKGAVFDPASGQVRQATAQERQMSLKGVPEVAYRKVKERVRTFNGSGQITRSSYDIPERAQQEGTFLFLVPAGHKDAKGNDVWYLEGYHLNQRIFQRPVLNVPMNDGDYKVNNTYNYSPFANWAHKQDVTNFIKWNNKNGQGLTMYVRSKPREELLVQSNDSGYKAGALDARGDLSINKEDYKTYGNGEEDYGYPALRRNTKLRKAIHEAAKKLGVPGVWIADQIERESSFIDQTNEFGYRGYFQLDPALEPKLGITKAMMSDSYRQIAEAYVIYMKWVSDEVNGFRNYEEFLMAVWGGANGINQLRNGTVEFDTTFKDAYVTWDEYRRGSKRTKGVGTAAGRRYRWRNSKDWGSAKRSSRILNTHDIASDNCPVCNSMMRAGTFQTHIYNS